MANPQAEDGHVDIANQIVEALARTRLSGEEIQCLWVIFRKTYGWKKTEDIISLSQFTEMTGLKKQHVHRALLKLSSKKVIAITKNGDRHPNMIRFIKDFDIWLLSPKKGIYPNLVKGITKNGDKTITKNGEYKRNKDTITKDKYTVDFLNFWNAYPKKAGKKAAWQSWIKSKDKPSIESILSCIEKQKSSIQWNKDNGQFIPNPSTWINQGRWDDVLESGPYKESKKYICPKCGKENLKSSIWEDGCTLCIKLKEIP